MRRRGRTLRWQRHNGEPPVTCGAMPQEMLEKPESKTAVEDGTTIVSDVLPQELAQQALALLEAVMQAKTPDDVLKEMHKWAKWADPETLQRIFTQAGGLDFLTGDGVRAVRTPPRSHRC